MSKTNKKYQIHIKSSKKDHSDDLNSSEDLHQKKAGAINPEKYKDFQKVYTSYMDSIYKKPWYRFQFHQSKNRKIALFIMLMILVAALLLLDQTTE
jgi:hypothetical protein